MEITKDKIEEYAGMYDRHYKGTSGALIEDEMKEWLKSHRYLDKDKFIKIGLWKSKRPKKHYENNSDLLIREITQFSFETENEEVRIKSLLILHGVSYPVASVLLHFAFPHKYAVMDFRAIWSLGWSQSKSYDFDYWQKYCGEMRKISVDTGLDMRTIDKALWEYSKQNQTRAS